MILVIKMKKVIYQMFLPMASMKASSTLLPVTLLMAKLMAIHLNVLNWPFILALEQEEEDKTSSSVST